MHLHFSNLGDQTTQLNIYMLLAGYASTGHCSICHVKNNITREAGTFALVDMSSLSEAENAIKLLNGTMFGGLRLVVQMGH